MLDDIFLRRCAANAVNEGHSIVPDSAKTILVFAAKCTGDPLDLSAMLTKNATTLPMSLPPLPTFVQSRDSPTWSSPANNKKKQHDALQQQSIYQFLQRRTAKKQQKRDIAPNIYRQTSHSTSLREIYVALSVQRTCTRRVDSVSMRALPSALANLGSEGTNTYTFT